METVVAVLVVGVIARIAYGLWQAAGKKAPAPSWLCSGCSRYPTEAAWDNVESEGGSCGRCGGGAEHQR